MMMMMMMIMMMMIRCCGVHSIVQNLFLSYLLCNAVIIAWKISLFKTLFLLFKYVTSETKEFFATKTNALLVGTWISVDYVCVSIALAVAKGRKVYKNHKENTNFILPLAEIRVLFCLIYLLASFWGPQFECATQESRCKKKGMQENRIHLIDQRVSLGNRVCLCENQSIYRKKGRENLKLV